jgi:low temperature requirement protein LtrA
VTSNGQTGLGPTVDEEVGVSTLELFFDLVFVFTLTQLTSLLERSPTFETAAQVLLVFVVLFWMYGGYGWLTNQVPPNQASRRLLLIAGMSAFLICALAVPAAFSETGVAFGVGYLLVVLVHGGMYAEMYGRAVWRFVPLNVVGALCLIAAGLAEGVSVYLLWLVPLALQYLVTMATRSVGDDRRDGFDLRPRHFVERHGLLLIVALGESVVAIGIGVGGLVLGVDTYAAAVLGLILIAAMWWAYFVEDGPRAESVLVGSSPRDRLAMAINGYFYSFIPMLLGIVVLAAGLSHAVGDVSARLDTGYAVMLAGGAALFLLGSVLFRRSMGITGSSPRVISALGAGATVWLGTELAALAQIMALVALVISAQFVIVTRQRT